MGYSVVFSPEAVEQLTVLYRYLTIAASPDTARKYVDGLVGYCETLVDFPVRGRRRDDIRPGLRTTPYRKRTTIAFTLDVNTVSIIGIYYGGQYYESDLMQD